MNSYDPNVEKPCTEEFDDGFKERLLKIIKNSLNGRIDNNADAAMLFHWLRHQDDPAYSFVPDKYRRK